MIHEFTCQVDSRDRLKIVADEDCEFAECDIFSGAFPVYLTPAQARSAAAALIEVAAEIEAREQMELTKDVHDEPSRSPVLAALVVVAVIAALVSVGVWLC